MPNLTDRSLKALRLKPGQKDRIVFDSECPGLGVRLTAAGTRKFVCQWTDPAIRRKVREPIGVWGAITIEQARTAARARLGEVAKGVDPTAERKLRKLHHEAERAEAALSLNDLIEDWTQRHLVHRRPRYAADAPRALRSAFADYLKKPAARLSRSDVIGVLDDLATRGKGTSAGRTMAYARACFTWASKRELVRANPFHNLPIASTTSERDRVLSGDELADIRRAAESLPYPWGPFYLIALYTLQRREEVAGMRWSELSPDLTRWTIPAGRMKNARTHDVHLSEAPRAILRGIDRFDGQDLVFSTNGNTAISGFSKAKLTLDHRIAQAKSVRPAHWRLHDFRRTGVSRLAALGFDSIVADKLLAHKPVKLRGVASVYQRHEFLEERKRALQVWAAYLTGDRTGATVLPFKPGA